MTLVLYHNPGCSKSRAALALLRDRGVAVEIVEYLRTPPTVNQLTALRDQLGLPVRQFIRDQEQGYAVAGLDDPSLDDAALLGAIAAHPILLQRPILSDGVRAVIGRPPEAILELLGQD